MARPAKPAVPNDAPPVRVPKRATPPDRIPAVVDAPAPSEHLAILSRGVFQAGMSWSYIDGRWDDYRAAFEDFAIERVAAYGEADVERILGAGRVMRSRGKIDATVRNARALLDAARAYGSIRAYQTSVAYAALRDDARKRFAYVGDLTLYYWLFRTGAPVPPFEEWLRGQDRDHPRMREMVLRARAEGRSSEQPPVG